MSCLIRNTLTATALLVATHSAHASNPIVNLQWSAEGQFEHQATVGAGKFLEVCGKLATGSSVQWRFETSAPLDFNIHYHLGKDVVFPVKLNQATAAQDVLAVAAPQDHCWMWTNKGTTTATLKLEMRR